MISRPSSDNLKPQHILGGFLFARTRSGAAVDQIFRDGDAHAIAETMLRPNGRITQGKIQAGLRLNEVNRCT